VLLAAAVASAEMPAATDALPLTADAAEPAQISRTHSHGCIRLTNWDAIKLAQQAHEGTPRC
jgi:hypothetical protein